MNDNVVVALLVLGFAVAVTAHVTLVAGLVRHTPRWHALVAFVVPPLAPVWGFRARMFVRSIAWMIGVIAYFVGRGFALR